MLPKRNGRIWNPPLRVCLIFLQKQTDLPKVTPKLFLLLMLTFFVGGAIIIMENFKIANYAYF